MSATEDSSGGDAPVPHICLIAGEPSGDNMGALMMREIDRRLGGRVRFSGIGGTGMTSAGAARGFESFFPMEELSIGGIFEVVPHIPHVLRRIRETADCVRDLNPDVLLTIDAPAFGFRVGKKLKGSGIRHAHYVAPTVWGWRPGRARAIAQFLDHLFVIFPFEPPYFEKWGLPCTYVGHPVAEMGLEGGDGAGFRRSHGIAGDAPLLCVLPGSRRAEIARILPPFGDAVARMKQRFPDLAVVVPTVPTVAESVKSAVASWSVPVTVTTEFADKRDAFAASDAALAASGTVTYELAMAGVPMVVAYKLSYATALVLALMVYAKRFSAVNIVLGRDVAPELIQHKCTPANLAGAMGDLLADPEALRRQREDLALVADALGRGGRPASESVTDVILKML